MFVGALIPLLVFAPFPFRVASNCVRTSGIFAAVFAWRLARTRFICVAPEPLGSERKRHVITSIACPCLMSMTNVMSISHVHEWPLCHNACRSRKRARACVWVATGADARDCATFPLKKSALAKLKRPVQLRTLKRKLDVTSNIDVSTAVAASFAVIASLRFMTLHVTCCNGT